MYKLEDAVKALLESGTDIRLIQDLLGQISVNTAIVYLHVADMRCLEIITPLK